MSIHDKFAATDDAWESRELGRDEEFVKRADPSVSDALEAALGLQMISIRLQKTLISDMKFIATAHGVGYQPLVRDVLGRFVVHEKKKIIQEVLERKRLEAELEAQKEAEAKKAAKKAA